ncbi:Serine protease [Lobulomyces angularis]|nr:Serine protease [Lobulomyces angularis]
MKFSLVASTVLISAITSAPARDDNASVSFAPEIVGGEPVESQFSYPWMASYSMYSYDHYCGGTLIAKNLLMTAAHCNPTGNVANVNSVSTFRYDFTKTRAEEQSIEFKVEKIFNHPQYNQGGTNKNDISIWVLKQVSNPANRDVVYAKYAKSVAEPPKDLKIRALGWGATRQGGSGSKVLLQVDVPVVDNEECNRQYPGQIFDSSVCAAEVAGGKDTCQGDSGGPIFSLNESGDVTVSGITSWGRGCALAGYAGVYSRVGSHTDFIQSYIDQYAQF